MGIEPILSGSQPDVQKPPHHEHRVDQAARPGLEPGTSHSKREMISISPSSRRTSKRKARDSNSHFTFKEALISSEARQRHIRLPSDFQKWTTGESNSDFLCAKQVSSRWTSSPSLIHASLCVCDAKVAKVGVEPTKSRVSRTRRFARLRTWPFEEIARIVELSSTERIRTFTHHGLKMAAHRWRTVPSQSKVARVGFEPTASLVLNQSGLPVAYRAVCLSRVPRTGIEPASSRV